MEAVRIIKEMREHDRCDGRADELVRCRYGCWENVPGARSSNNGEDFRTVLEELARVCEADITIPRPKKWEKSGFIIGDGWSIAYREMDAQYFGLPQRRRRITVLCDFGGYTAPDILLTESVRQTDYHCRKPSVMGASIRYGREVQSVRESLRGYLEPCVKAWKGIARDPEESSGECYTLKVRGGEK